MDPCFIDSFSQETLSLLYFSSVCRLMSTSQHFHLHRAPSMMLRDVSVKDFIDEQVNNSAFEPVGYLGGESLSPLTLPSTNPYSVSASVRDTPLADFLRNSPHLFTLPTSELRHVADNVLRREYGYLDTVLNYNDEMDHVFLVLAGSVEVFSLQGNGASERVGSVTAGDLFGFDAIIFEERSEFRYVAAGGKKTCIGLIPKHLFLDILERHVAVAQSVGRKLAEHMDVFLCFKEFCRHVFSHETAKNEYLPLWTILDSYTRLNNCIHAKMRSTELDTGAWSYAIKRLPENVTRTFCFDLVRGLPPFVASRMRALARSVDKKQVGNHDEKSRIGEVRYIVTKERRRCSWQLGMDGKTMVLLRDGFTDILDFITCLCIHIIESNKLRARLQGMVHPPVIDVLDEILNCPDCTGEKLATETKKVLARMPLSKEEQSGLLKLWPGDLLARIYEILMHREEFMLRVDASISRSFQTDPFHEWALNLRAAVMRKCSLPSTSPLPPNLTIDIISSNTHCTKNLLGPFARKHRKEILAYASSKDLNPAAWHTEEDMVYFISTSFLQSRPDLQAEYNNMLKECDITVMEDTAMTGLQVDIIPCRQIDVTMIDPVLEENLRGAKKTCFSKRHFILNMDFAFGAQAEGIIKTLISTFGRSIRSINVMGKAGGLVGTRGDIQIASHVLLSKSSLTTEDFQDELRSCGNQDITMERMRELIGPHVGIHHGTVLTIPGTMLQNVKLLRFYKRIWKCVGVEMEGSYFARMIHEMKKAEIIDPNLITRFAYYTSDLPLAAATDSNLATPMKPTEGVPPLYAIARAILERVLAIESCSFDSDSN